jgi:hypothetical protein
LEGWDDTGDFLTKAAKKALPTLYIIKLAVLVNVVPGLNDPSLKHILVRRHHKHGYGLSRRKGGFGQHICPSAFSSRAELLAVPGGR